jgi:hypothetical protein
VLVATAVAAIALLWSGRGRLTGPRLGLGLLTIAAAAAWVWR